MKTSMSGALGAALFLSLAAIPSKAAELLVDPAGSPGSFPTIGAAVTAAQPGDRIRVLAGVYSEGVLIQKSLRILAEPGAVLRQPQAWPPLSLSVRDLAPGSEVVISGLKVEGVANGLLLPGFEPHAVQVVNAAGRVVLHGMDIDATSFSALVAVNASQLMVLDCHMSGNLSPQGACGAFPLVQLAASTAYLVNSTLEGADGFADPICARPGMGALRANLSKVVLHNSALLGGASGDQQTVAHPGAPAVEAAASQLEVRRGLLQGGDGGSAAPTDSTFPELQYGPGGPALALTAASTVSLFPSASLIGGVSGDGFVQATALSLANGSQLVPGLGVVPGLDVLLPLTPAVGLGQSLALGLVGQPNDIQLLLLSTATGAPLSLPGWSGELLLSTAGLTSLGPVVLDAAGQGQWGATVPNQPALIGTTAFFQSLAPLGATPAAGNLVLVPVGF